ncbi:MAG: CapA family protein [Verrucomicrobiota bacterium]|jgi:poly-gamma-glutamate synthesis protein (capsule biosynthesis protein)
MITILIGADICPIGGNRPYFMAGDAQSLLNDLRVEFEQTDLCIANLECPLIETPCPILKTGPIFGEPNAVINGLKHAGVDVLALANNHILDHGTPGLKNTLAVCASAGIATVGAGENLQAARRILIRDVGGLRIGILAVAEHEFSIATSCAAGANPLDLIDFVRNITRNRKSCDYLIVLLHGSDEFFVPTPRIKDTCHFMVEMGVNAVIVQHPHCLGAYEEYKSCHIVYGQGALIMDEAIYRNRKSFHEGFLVKLRIAQDARSSMEILPFVQSDPLPGARRMNPERERQFLQSLLEKCNAVKDDAWVQAQWRSFCEGRKHSYLSSLLGHNRVLSKLNAKGLVAKFVHGKRSLLRAKNTACCETHREAIETIFSRPCALHSSNRG